MDIEFMGRDWALIYRTVQDAPCIVCRRPTRLLVAFKPGTTLSICGSCRGY